MPCQRPATAHELEPLAGDVLLLDEAGDDAVAVVAGLDAIDAVAEHIGVAANVREVMQTRRVQVIRHGERELRTVEVRADHLDRSVLDVGATRVDLGRHPVAEKHVDPAGLHRLVGHRHRDEGGVRRVAKIRQHRHRERRRRRDVTPADVGEVHVLTGLGVAGRLCGRREPEGAHFRGYTEAQLESIHASLTEIKATLNKMTCELDTLRQWRRDPDFHAGAREMAGIALGIGVMEEVGETRPIHTLPHRREGVLLGVVNVRGELLACVSVGRLLGIEKGVGSSSQLPSRSAGRMLVVSHGGERYAFPVTEVRGVQHLALPAEPQASDAIRNGAVSTMLAPGCEALLDRVSGSSTCASASVTTLM